MSYSFNPFTGNFDNTPSTLKGDNAYSNVFSNSATWVDGYQTGTVYKENSATYATINFTNSKFFPLTGGVISGATRINGNVTIFGDLSSTGTQTFANTIFATTSALSVVHVGSGPAVWIGNNGSGDIASFYDIDQGVEVFHIGGANGTFPNVGVKTSSPNKDFTVSGEISATKDIWTTGRIMSGGQELASIFRSDIDKGLSVFNTVQSNSATNWNYQGTDLKNLSAGWIGGNAAFTNLVSNSAAYLSSVDLSFLSVSANWDSVYNTVLANSAVNWNYQGTDLKGLSANWQNTYTNVNANSGAWSNPIDTGVRSLTGFYSSVYSTVQSNSAANWNYQGSDLKSLSSNWVGGNAAFTNLVSNSAAYLSSVDLSFLSVSANWDSVYSTVQSNSATNWNYQGTDLKDLSASWQSTYTNFSAQSAKNDSVYSTVNANSATAWNYQGTDLKNLSAQWIGGNAAFTNLVSNSAAYLSSVDLSFLSVSANWDSVYSNVNANSATYATIAFTNSKFFPVSGGIITGPTQFNNNLTVYGNISATGSSYFSNTFYSTTSALSVVNIGNSGPALYVGNNGTGDIASFYDIDQNVEILHVGGSNGIFPNVGVKTSSPNKDFTVNGEISATGDIWTSGRILSGNQELASIFRPDIDKGLSVFNTVQSNSATNWNYQGTDLKSLSGNWQSTYTTVSALSANWNSVYTTVNSNSANWNFTSSNLSNYFPLTGGTITGVVSVSGNISTSGVISASASKININVVNDTTSRVFTDNDSNKVVHIDTTTNSLCAIFPDNLSSGFSVAIMNIGTNNLILSAANLKSAGTIITTQYGGAFVYKELNNIFAVGRLV